MNARLSALIAAIALTVVPSHANLAAASDASLSRQTGIGLVIGQQGNEALHRIRTELAVSLRQNAALPELSARVELSRNESGVASGTGLTPSADSPLQQRFPDGVARVAQPL